MSDSWRSTSYDELVLDPSSPDEGFSLDNGRASRRILVNWDDRLTAVTDFLGTTTVVTLDPSTRYVSRTVPHTYPDAPLFYAVAAPRVLGIGPKGKTGADSTMLARYARAEITLTYAAPIYDVKTDDELVSAGDINDREVISEGVALKNGRPRYVVRESRASSRLLVLSRGLMKTVEATPRVFPEGVPISVPSVDLLYTWMLVPNAAVPRNAHMQAIGCVNSEAFDGFPAGTLLCETPDIKPITDPFGSRFHNVQYRFKFLPNNDVSTTPPTPRGWNYVLKPVDVAAVTQLRFYKLTSSGTEDGTPLYQSFDFTRLFEPDRE